MSDRKAAVILCEDLQAQVVLWRLFKRKWGGRFPRVRVLPLPAGKGCGSQYVRGRYADEVHAQRASSVAQVLVVHIDGDDVGLQGRTSELAAQLQAAGKAARGASEPIAHVIPCWETETWILHALGETVAEGAKAPRKFRGEEAKAAAPLVDLLDRLVDGKAAAPSHLPALSAVVPELQRL